MSISGSKETGMNKPRTAGRDLRIEIARIIGCLIVIACHMKLPDDISGGHDLNMFRMLVYAIQVSKMQYQQNHDKAFLTLPEIFWIATKSAGSFFGKVGSFEPGYEFDALVIDDEVLHPDEYSLLHRLERFIYLGDDRQILHRFCRGKEVPEPR